MVAVRLWVAGDPGLPCSLGCGSRPSKWERPPHQDSDRVDLFRWSLGVSQVRRKNKDAPNLGRQDIVVKLAFRDPGHPPVSFGLLLENRDKG